MDWTVGRYDAFVAEYRLGKGSNSNNNSNSRDHGIIDIEYQLSLRESNSINRSNCSTTSTTTTFAQLLSRSLPDTAAFVRVTNSALKLPLLLHFLCDHLTRILGTAVSPFQRSLTALLKREEYNRLAKRQVDGAWASAMESQFVEERDEMLKRMKETIDRIEERIKKSFASLLVNNTLCSLLDNIHTYIHAYRLSLSAHWIMIP